MPQQTTTAAAGYNPTPSNPATPAEPASAEMVEETDDLLEEIDAVLEENALETLRSYVQRGGQ